MTIIILITLMKITRKMVQQGHMGIKNRGRECSEIEEEFYRRRGMSGRGFLKEHNLQMWDNLRSGIKWQQSKMTTLKNRST
jgi:hypothetical protein